MNFKKEQLTFRQKRILKSSQRRVLVDSIEIGLASPEQIREWSRRVLPNKILSGEVLTPKTVDYKTLKPIRDGLFCEKIFGPTRDFMCSCGKKRINKSFCTECDVEHTEARVRRYRLGHINLISPVTHVWYLRGRPSYISTLLGKKRRSLEALAYCTTFLPEYIIPTPTSYFNEVKTHSSFSSKKERDEEAFYSKKKSFFQKKPFFDATLYKDFVQGKELIFQARQNERPQNFSKEIPSPFKKELTRFAFRQPFSESRAWYNNFSSETKISSQTLKERKGSGWSKTDHFSQGGRPTSPRPSEKQSSKAPKGKEGFLDLAKKSAKPQPLIAGLRGVATSLIPRRVREKEEEPLGTEWNRLKEKRKKGTRKDSNTKLIRVSKKIRDFKGNDQTNNLQTRGKKILFEKGILFGKKSFSSLVSIKKDSSIISLKKKGKDFASLPPTNRYKKDFLNFKYYYLISRKGQKISLQEYSRNKKLPAFQILKKKPFYGRSSSRLYSINPFPNLYNSLSFQNSPRVFESLYTEEKKFDTTSSNTVGTGFPSVHQRLRKNPKTQNLLQQVGKVKKNQERKRFNGESQNRFFLQNFYSQSQTLPIPPTFACELEERAKFLEYIFSLSGYGDKKISLYSGIQRKHPLEVVYGLQGAHLLSGDDGIEQILSYTGGEAIREMINRFNMSNLRRFLTFEVESLSLEIVQLKESLPKEDILPLLGKIIKKRARHWRRLKLAQLFSKSCKRPEWMVLSALPVLPPDLRPILRLDGDVLVVSDLNQLYQKVLFRNSRFQRLGIVTVESIAYAKGLLQEAVDALLDNGKGGAAPMVAPNDRPLKSLSDILKGKRGRFRQNLLGKRVDYSGRSVIVVGPKLLLHQCGLPREMALELFQPFIIRKLLAQKLAKGIGVAKRMIQEADPIVWEILSQLIRQHPLLLNRAPTLHRLGIQAFQPLLVTGRAILLHPLVCTAFNADFDGDQMAVHIPLSAQARAESWKLLWSRNNILSPATGQPVLLPSQDMVLGCYYLTQMLAQKKQINPMSGSEITSDFQRKGILELGIKVLIPNNMYLQSLRKKKRWFANLEEVKRWYDQGFIGVHERVWMRVQGSFENGTQGEKPIELQVQNSGFWKKISPRCQIHFDSVGKTLTKMIQTTAGRVLINEILQIEQIIE
jgi:DNA-directed RNA polymerase beta' subunit